MAKKQIKHIMVKVETEGAKSTNSQLEIMEEHIFNINAGFRALDKGGSLDNLAKLGKSLQSINRALSGDTKKLTKSISGYIDNLELVSLSLKEVATHSRDANKALNKTNNVMSRSGISTSTLENKLDVMIGSLMGLEETFEDVSDSMTAMNRVMGITAENLDDINNSTDAAGRAQREYQENLDKNHKKRRNQEKDQEGWHRKGNSRIRSFSKLAFGMNPLVSTYAAIAVNVYALSEAFRVLSDAAGYARLQETTASFAAAISGINVKALAAELQEAAAGALDMKEALKFATKGVSFNFTTEQLVKLTDGARRASIALGINFTDAMDRVTRGISKQEIELFDELGIVTRLTPAFQKLAVTLNKSVDELSDYERQLALTNEVQRQLEEKYSGVQKYATGWEKLGVAVSNFTTNLLKNSAVGMDSWIGKMADYITKLTPVSTAQDKAAESLKIFNDAMDNNMLPQAAQAYAEYNKFMQESIDKRAIETQAVNDHNSAVGALSDGIKLLAVAWATVFAANVLSATVSGIGGVVAAIKGFRTATLSAAAAVTLLTAPVTAVILAVVALGAYLTGGFDKVSEYIDSVVTDIFSASSKLSQPVSEVQEGMEKTAESSRKAAEGAKEMSRELAALNVQLDLNSARVVATARANAAADKYMKDNAELFKTHTEHQKQMTRSNVFAARYEGELTKAIAEGTETLRDRAQASIAWVNGMEDAKKSILEVTQSAQEAKTPLDKVIDKLKEYETPTLVSDDDKVNMKLWEGLLQDLKDAKVINESILPKDMPEFLNTMREVNAQSKDFKKNFSTELKLGTLQDFSSDRDLNEKKRELEGVTEELRNQDRLSFTANSKDAEALRLKQQILQAEIKRGEVLASIARKEDNTSTRNAILQETNSLEAKINNTVRFQKQQKQEAIDYDKQMLEYQLQKGAISLQEYHNQQLILGTKQAILDKQGEEVLALQEQSAVFSSIGNITGLTESQAAIAGIGGTMTDLFADLAEQDIGLAELFEKDTDRLVEVANSAMSVIGSIYGAISDAKVAGYDREIEAEKRRDGKSAESLAKIKKLEAKKIKEQAKAKKIQVIMSTSVAAAKALELGPILGPVMAGLMVTMGMFQLSQIDKAMGGQLAALSSGPSSMSLTGGSSNTPDVNVGSSATASEYSAQSSVPGRVGGNHVAAGASVEIGERGVEEITPLVPSMVTPSGKGGSGTSIDIGGIHLNDVVDAASFEDRIEGLGQKLREVLETELNTTNQTLESL